MRYLLLCLISVNVWAQTSLTVEGGAIWQNQNVVRIPGDTGTKFSLSDLNTGPYAGYRVYAGHRWNDRHELRGLFAPLVIEEEGRYDRAIDFRGQTFAANTDTKTKYKFNSYRLTYAYHFASAGSWQFALGFTGKVRDAEIRLQQGATVAKKPNVGFVPLLNFQARWQLSDSWLWRLDMDGLASPQGRAFDVGVFLEKAVASGWSVYTGYRTVEGGADNDKVYTFAWLHSAALGVTAQF